MILLGLLFIPIVIAAVAFWKFPNTITWKEWILQALIQTALITAGYFIAKHQALESTEHLNGRITAKAHDSEKCCHCRMVCDGYRTVQSCTGSGKTRSCSSSQECTGWHEECDHYQDYYWSLKSTVGNIKVDSCEPNKDRVPALWQNASVGDPASIPHTYTNYLKADPESLHRHQELEHFNKHIPEFPKVYDRYKVNPVMGPAPQKWQQAFREINADLGAKNQVDVTLLATSIQDPAFAQAVEAKWLFGPKNSLNIVIGVQGDDITWARVVTFSKVEDLKIYLRDELQGKKLSDDIPAIVRDAVATKFKRTAMADYEYLARAAKPSTGWVVALYILGLALAIGLAILMHKHDVFGDEGPRPHKFRRFR